MFSISFEHGLGYRGCRGPISPWYLLSRRRTDRTFSFTYEAPFLLWKEELILFVRARQANAGRQYMCACVCVCVCVCVRACVRACVCERARARGHSLSCEEMRRKVRQITSPSGVLSVLSVDQLHHTSASLSDQG